MFYCILFSFFFSLHKSYWWQRFFFVSLVSVSMSVCLNMQIFKILNLKQKINDVFFVYLLRFLFYQKRTRKDLRIAYMLNILQIIFVKLISWNSLKLLMQKKNERFSFKIKQNKRTQCIAVKHGSDLKLIKHKITNNSKKTWIRIYKIKTNKAIWLFNMWTDCSAHTHRDANTTFQHVVHTAERQPQSINQLLKWHCFNKIFMPNTFIYFDSVLFLFCGCFVFTFLAV